MHDLGSLRSRSWECGEWHQSSLNIYVELDLWQGERLQERKPFGGAGVVHSGIESSLHIEELASVGEKTREGKYSAVSWHLTYLLGNGSQAVQCSSAP